MEPKARVETRAAEAVKARVFAAVVNIIEVVLGWTFYFFRVNFFIFFLKWVGCGMKKDYCGVVNVLVFIVTGY